MATENPNKALIESIGAIRKQVEELKGSEAHRMAALGGLSHAADALTGHGEHQLKALKSEVSSQKSEVSKTK